MEEVEGELVAPLIRPFRIRENQPKIKMEIENTQKKKNESNVKKCKRARDK